MTAAEIETVARAMCVADGWPEEVVHDRGHTVRVWEEYTRQARQHLAAHRAIKAMEGDTLTSG
jgi:phytoene/squalene synthetase